MRRPQHGDLAQACRPAAAPAIVKTLVRHRSGRDCLGGNLGQHLPPKCTAQTFGGVLHDFADERDRARYRARYRLRSPRHNRFKRGDTLCGAVGHGAQQPPALVPW